MIDEELKTYVIGLLRQGYELDQVRKILLQAGHEISHVERISRHAFEHFHKDLLEYIEKEIQKGRPIAAIKEDLLKVGHSERKLQQVINYHQRKHMGQTLQENLDNTIKEEKKWFRSWMSIYVYLILFVIILFLIISVFLLFYDDSEKSIEFEKRVDACKKILTQGGTNPEFYNKLCIAVINDHEDLCHEMTQEDKISKCTDTFFLYSSYRSSDQKKCNRIENIDLKDFCFQINDKQCNNYFGYGEYCDAIMTGDITKCTGARDSPIIEKCRENFKMFSAVKDGRSKCNGLADKSIYNLCVAMSK